MPILPWLAHLYTSAGVVLALLATAATFANNFRAAFIYLVVATIVDATDGVLARAVRVKERLPHFDGALLDNLIDYLTYVFVPALIVWRADLVPSAFPIWQWAFSGIRFSRNPGISTRSCKAWA